MQHLIQLLDFFMHKIMQLFDGLLANVNSPILTIQAIPTESNVQFYFYFFKKILFSLFLLLFMGLIAFFCIIYRSHCIILATF